MNDDLASAVQSRRLELELDELTGRATPPDRCAAILQRAASEGAAWRPPATRWRRLAVLGAGALGLAATIGVVLFQRAREESPSVDSARFVAQPMHPLQSPLVVAGQQDPAPPQPVPPAPTQEPKPAPAPKPQVQGTPATDKPVKQPTGKPTDKPATHEKGTSIEDVRAKRSAERMLEVERRLEALLKEGKRPGFNRRLRFETLNGWPYKDGLDGMPDPVKALDGTKVLMLGFMLPIDEVTGMKQFLLVPSLWSCCFGTPPDIHGIVRVVMPKDKTADYTVDPVQITGTFRVSVTREEGYCLDIYQLHVETIEPIEPIGGGR